MNTKIRPSAIRANVALAAALGMAAMSTGCGGVGARDESPDGSGGRTDQPLYVIGHSYYDDNFRSLATFSTTLDTDADFDYSQSIEFPGGAGMYGPDEPSGYFIAALCETPELVRYELDDTGRFREKRRLSLSNLGVDCPFRTPAAFVFVSTTKAYFLDQDTLQGVIFNPESMEIDGTIDLSSLERDGLSASFSFSNLRRDGQVLFVTSWANFDDGRYPNATALVAIDTATDQIASIEEDDRCSQVQYLVSKSNGDTFAACSANVGSVHAARGSDFASPPCMLKIPADSTRFDPDYFVELGDLTAGAPAGGLIAGPGAFAYTQVFEEAAFNGDPQDAQERNGAKAWRWWRVDLVEQTATATDLDLAAALVVEFQIDGKAYTSSPADDFSESLILEMTADAGPRPGATIGGFPNNAIRVR